MNCSMVLIVVAFWLGVSGVLCDDATSKETSTLCDARLDRLERHLTVELLQLRTRLTDVETEKDAQSAELRTQKQTQNAELQTQKAELQTQKAELQTQKAELQALKVKLQAQKAEMQTQKAELQTQQAELQTQNADLRAALAALNTVRGEASSSSRDASPLDSPSQDPSVVAAAASSPSDVMARSDDGGPLEAVVMQMGQRLTTVQADVQVLQTSASQLSRDLQTALTSTYTHWGSAGCGNASDLVYSGVVGGSYYGHTGAATNYLCLTMSPVASQHSLPPYAASLYGGEYQTFDHHESYDMDPLCAVCRSSLPNTVMIPGTNVCTPGWRTQYTGFLMAGQQDHPAGSEFICVDSQFESRPGSDKNNDGKLLYFTVTKCGSLPCEPYVANKIVTCVVCSK